VASWWTLAPNANIGVACAPSGLLVVDVDPRNGGDETFGALARELGPTPATWTVLTPGGGAHYYFRHDGDAVGGGLGAGVDLKHQGYVVAPPSVHPNGGTYRWDAGAHPMDTPLAILPSSWLLRAVRPRTIVRAASSGQDARESFLGAAFQALGWLGAPLPGGRRVARCPWAAAHTDGRGNGRDSSTVLFPRNTATTLGGFACSHGHCAGRRVADVLRALPPDAIDAGARAFPYAYRLVVWRLASTTARAL
jgi:hypothetical protein